MFLHLRMFSIIFCFYTFVVFAQIQKTKTNDVSFTPAASFEHFTLEEGSPSNSVHAIYRDALGFVWYSTNLGLVRYDGYDFKVYTHDETDTTSISSSDCGQILPDSSGNLWILANGVLNFLDLKKETFKKYRFTDKDEFKDPSTSRIFIDSKKRYWIGNGAGVGLFDPNTGLRKKFTHNPNDSNSIGKRGIMVFTEDSDKNVWLTTYDEGISRYNPQNNNFSNFKYNNSNPYSLLNTSVWSMLSDDEGSLYLSYRFDNQYLGKFNTKTGKHTKIENEHFKLVTKLLMDFKGNIWIASISEGLLKYNPQEHSVIQFRHEPNNPESISETRINEMYIDKDNNLWAASLNKGFNKLNLNYTSVNLYNIPLVDNKKPKIFQLFEDKTKNIWIATDKGLFKLDHKTHKINYIKVAFRNSINHTIERICYGNNGNLWLQGTDLIYELNPETYSSKILNNPISNKLLTNTYTDKNGGFWFVSDYALEYYQHGEINTKPIIKIKVSGSQDKYAFSNFIEEDSIIYINVERTLYRINKFNVTDTLQIISPNSRRISSIYKRKNDIYAFSDYSNFYVTNPSHTALEDKRLEFMTHSEVTPIGYFYDENNICFSTYRGIYLYNVETKAYYHPRVYNPDKIDPDVFFKSSDNTFYMAAGDGFISFNPKELEFKNQNYNNIALVDFYLFNKPANVGQEDSPLQESITFAKEVTLTHEQAVFSFEMSLLNMDEVKFNEYAYKLEGYDKEWSYIGDRKVATYTNLPAGEYIFKYTACNKNGVWAKTKEIKVIILPPFWETWWFRLLSIITVCSGVVGFFQYRTQRIRKHNEELETQVKHRTAEIMSQNEEILAQKEEIERQEAQIHELYNDVTDSIQTAQRIQESILPPENLINECVSEAFVLYIPKDIVSGDFYWIHTDLDITYIAAVDCTGHGVAGAFMSLIGYNLLSRIMKEEKNPSPSLILSRLNSYVIQVLNQENENAISKEGMEISLCMVDKKTKEVTFTGANNKLYIARNKTIEIINGDINPVGIMPLGKTAKFTEKVITAEEGDIFYIFSDGFAGQFGGESGNDKLKYPKFRDYLLDIHTLPISEQKMALFNKFNNWKGETLQTDDIMVIGFRV